MDIDFEELKRVCAENGHDFMVWQRLGTDISFDHVMKNGTSMEASGWATGFNLYCWYNSMALWRQTTEQVQVFLGMARGKMNDYQPSAHMWLSVDNGKSAIETVESHADYRGVALTDEEAEVVTAYLMARPHGSRLFADCHRLYKQRGIIRDCKKKTTSRLITKSSRKGKMLFHPVKAKEIRRQYGTRIPKQLVWTSI